MARYIMVFVDCKGKMCYNGGTINMKSCKCTCPKPYKGSLCQQRKSMDLIYFSYYGKRWKKLVKFVYN